MHSIPVHGRNVNALICCCCHPGYKRRAKHLTVSNTGQRLDQLTSKLESAKQLNHVVTGIAIAAALGFAWGGQMLPSSETIAGQSIWYGDRCIRDHQ